MQAVATEAGATPAQVAPACLLTKGEDIAPIPGTKLVASVGENIAAGDLALTPAQIGKLNDLTPPSGGHHNEEQMRLIER